MSHEITEGLDPEQIPVRDSELPVMLRYAKRANNGDVPRLVASLYAARAALRDVHDHLQTPSCECVDIPRDDCCTCGCYEYSEALAHVARVLAEAEGLVQWKPDPIKPLLCDRCGQPCPPLEAERGGGKYVHMEPCRDRRK